MDYGLLSVREATLLHTVQMELVGIKLIHPVVLLMDVV
jgi:hypothetical protein